RRTFEFGYHDIELHAQRVFVISAPIKAYFPGVANELQASPSPPGRRWPEGLDEGGRAESLGHSRPHPALRAALSRRKRESERRWGIFAPMYALHSRRNPAAGDLTDFENLMDWMHGLGATVAGTLPLLGAFLDEPFDPAPYAPAT